MTVGETMKLEGTINVSIKVVEKATGGMKVTATRINAAAATGTTSTTTPGTTVAPAAGAAGFRCEAVAEKRPACVDGLCCGTAKAAAAAGGAIETCQPSATKEYVHKPATGPEEKWPFVCLTAIKLTLSAAALLGSAIMLE